MSVEELSWVFTSFGSRLQEETAKRRQEAVVSLDGRRIWAETEHLSDHLDVLEGSNHHLCTQHQAAHDTAQPRKLNFSASEP